MSYRVGMDIVEVSDVEGSIARFGDRYLRRVFTQREISACDDGSDVRCLATCFAAKEAALKTFGTDVGAVDLVFDLIGGEIGKRSARLVRAGGTYVSIVGALEEPPADVRAIDFVVEADRAQLGEIVERVRDGRLRTNIGTVASLDDAVAAFNPTERRRGETIIRVRG